jgi:DNA-binding SARP family transcriptional activator
VLYQVLGTLAIEKDGQVVDLPGGNARLVLAALLVKANHLLYSPDLLRIGWDGEDAPKAQLDKRISAVRRVLRSVDRAEQLITHRGFGYELRIPEDELDALRFRRLIIRAGEAKKNGDVDEEVARLREAVALWRGQFVASNGDNTDLRTISLPLEEQRQAAATRLFELELARQHHNEVLPDLLTLRRYHPTDGRLIALLMIAQRLSGDSIAAEATYEQYRVASEESSAAPPEKAVQQLKHAIAQRDDKEIERLASAFLANPAGTASVATSKPRQLPVCPTDLVGRDELVAEAEWVLRRPSAAAGADVTASRRSMVAAPVVVVSGPGGTGKTALAVYTAHRIADDFPGGQLFAELQGNSGVRVETDEVLTGFLHALGVTEPPASSADRVVLYRTLMADRRALVVLDDAQDEEQIRDLIPTGRECAVMVTARRLMPDVEGVHHLPRLGGLPPDRARALFGQIVIRSGVQPPLMSPDFERLLALCGGLPLALRIVAMLYVHDRLHSMAQLADRLTEHGSDLIEYGSRSLARSIGAGFDRLDEHAQRLFLGLALTAMPEFELWTAAAVLDDRGADPAAALSQLATYDMIERTGRGHRYRFHDLTRDYAHRRAVREVGDAGVQRRLMEHVYGALLTLARRAHRSLAGGDYEVVHGTTPQWELPAAVDAAMARTPALGWFDQERANIRAAVEHCAELGLAEVAWDLALTSHEFYATRRHFDDWYATHTVALAACQTAHNTRGTALLLVSLGQPILVASAPAAGVSGLPELQRSIDQLDAAGDRHGLAIAQRTMANALRRRGQLTVPLALFTSALANYEMSGDLLGQWQTQRFIGQTYLDQGEVRQALEALGRAWELGDRLGEPYALAQTSYWMGQARLAENNPSDARIGFAALFTAFDRKTSGVGAAYAAHARGDLALASGDGAAAEVQLRRAAALAQDAADATLQGRALLSMARLRRAQQRLDDEISALEDAVRCFADGDAVYLQAVALTALGEAEVARGDQAVADEVNARVMTLYRSMNLPAEDRVHRRLHRP